MGVLGLTGAAAGLVLVTASAAGPPAPTVSRQVSAVSGYNYKALVQIQLWVDWGEQHGSFDLPCSHWRSAVGQSRVVIDGTVAGHADFSAAAAAQRGAWAFLDGVGTMDPRTSWSRRRLKESTGDTRCGNVEGHITALTENDCETSKKERRSLSGPLHIAAARRRSLATLTDIVDAGPQGRHPVISADGTPFKDWYRQCRVSRLAPDLPVNLAGAVDDRDIGRLKKLQPGRTYTFFDQSGTVACARPTEGLTGDRCSGGVSVTVQFRRVRKGEPFP